MSPRRQAEMGCTSRWGDDVPNVFALGAVADFGTKTCQVTTKADAMHNVELTTKTAIEPNAC